MGLQHALIGGSYICAFVIQRLVERFRSALYERRFLNQAFIHPLYDPDEFLVYLDPLPAAENDEERLSVCLETRQARESRPATLVSRAQASACLRGIARASPARRTLAAIRCQRCRWAPPNPPDDYTLTIEETKDWREMAGDDLDWCTSSPFGGPIAPSFKYMLFGGGGQPAGGLVTDPPITAAMNGTFQLLQYGPLMIGDVHHVQGRLAEKGFSASTAYRTSEFVVTDASGKRVAIARQKISWIIPR